jgi:hypothetical protein
MTGARDSYQLSKKDQAAADVRAAWMRRELQDWFALNTIYHACWSSDAHVAGTLSNTILHAFVASDPRADPRHRAPHIPQFAELRVQAWRVLDGTG